jgi:polyhydroxyalkanoate synthesis regulator protein
MTDWRKQSDEMLKFVTQTQREMWDTWMKAATKAVPTSPTEAWDQAIATWRDAVSRSMNAQNEWMQLWADSIRSTNGVPSEAATWTDQMVSTMKTWNANQTRFWENWLDMLRTGMPTGMTNPFSDNMQSAFKMWQDQMERAMHAQQEFMKSMTGPK